LIIERRDGGGLGLFLLGVAVGAGIALLYAPQTGEEAREALRRGARRMRRQARHLAEEAQEAAVEFTETARTTARDAAREAREALEHRLARHRRPAPADEGDGEDDGV
jgi:gas vesicle protein